MAALELKIPAGLYPEDIAMLVRLRDLCDGQINDPRTADAIRTVARFFGALGSAFIMAKIPGTLGISLAAAATVSIAILAEQFIEDRTVPKT